MANWNEWSDDIVVVRDTGGKADQLEGRTWRNFAVIERAAFDALEPRQELVHITSQLPLGAFEDRDDAVRAAALLAIVGDWNSFRWPLTREEVGLLWFRAGLAPRPDASQLGAIVWAGTPPAWATPAIPDLAVEPPNGDGA